MSGDDIRVAVDYTDERFADIFLSASKRIEEGAVGGSFDTFFHNIAFHFSVSTK